LAYLLRGYYEGVNVAVSTRVPKQTLLEFIDYVNRIGLNANDDVESLLDVIDLYWPKLKSYWEGWRLIHDEAFRIMQADSIAKKLADQSGLLKNPLLSSLKSTPNISREEYSIGIKKGDHDLLNAILQERKEAFFFHAEIVIPWLLKHDKFNEAYGLLMRREGKKLKLHRHSDQDLKELFEENGYLYFLAVPALRGIRCALTLKIHPQFLNSISQAYVPNDKVIKLAKRLILELEKSRVSELHTEPLKAALTVDFEEMDMSTAFALKTPTAGLLNEQLIGSIVEAFSGLFDFSKSTKGRPYTDVTKCIMELCGATMTTRNLDRVLEQFDQKQETDMEP